MRYIKEWFRNTDWVSAKVRTINIAIVTAIVVAGFLLVYGVFRCLASLDSKQISATELRLYIWAGIIALYLHAFGSLRMYNATFANTRFMIKLHNKMSELNLTIKKFSEGLTQQHKAVERIMSILEKSISALNQTIGAMAKKVDNDDAR